MKRRWCECEIQSQSETTALNAAVSELCQISGNVLLIRTQLPQVSWRMSADKLQMTGGNGLSEKQLSAGSKRTPSFLL